MQPPCMGLAKQQGANPTLCVCVRGGDLQHNKVPHSRVGPPTQPGKGCVGPLLSLTHIGDCIGGPIRLGPPTQPPCLGPPPMEPPCVGLPLQLPYVGPPIQPPLRPIHTKGVEEESFCFI